MHISQSFLEIIVLIERQLNKSPIQTSCALTGYVFDSFSIGLQGYYQCDVKVAQILNDVQFSLAIPFDHLWYELRIIRIYILHQDEIITLDGVALPSMQPRIALPAYKTSVSFFG